ncbi:tetratricopeptide repeat protein [Vacuolonema iberomarrocanum]|uniref:tetratricopeptide repeat protein n=1 Tax=Vacuolonema iberomarrocanum TaxID=3454632 RepID=UPI001A0ED56B|nr:tetratricopeptide repeat protein [filamentous cyanobacterium LEGE 07170]
MPTPLQPPELAPTADPFLALNQEAFEQLVTFVDFVADRFTLGFVSVNFANDRDHLINHLRHHPRCQDIQFEVFHVPDPNLTFLRDALLEEIPRRAWNAEKKPVLVVTGLEYAIGMIGDYPIVLQDLNYVRDAFITSIPHPMLVCLPDSALTRLARYAPDFWAWRLAVFRFRTLPATAEQAMGQTLQSNQLRESLDAPSKQNRIDLLLRLLVEQEQTPSSIDTLKTRLEIINELGICYFDLGETHKAKDILTQGLNSNIQDEALNSIKSSLLNNMAGVIAQQGEVDHALSLWQQSLDFYERIDDVRGKAITLSQMAGVIAQQGEVDRSLSLWQQSLDILERIGDVRGKAATLNNMAGIIAQQGEVDRALSLWQQSLDILERIGDVKGKATTLANVAGETGDKVRQLELNLQAAQALSQVRAYRKLFAVLSNLGATAETHTLSYRAQAVWLSLRIQVPLPQAIQQITDLFNAVSQSDELKGLLAAYALFLCTQRGQGHPQLEQLQQLSRQMLEQAAGAQGIESPEAIEAWFTQQQLNDPNVFLPQLKAQLEALIGDQWAFERF